MAWNSAAMPIQGFTVFQTAPGAILSFVPAMGTAELDQLIDAYIVQAATIQEKRAIVSMEFFTHNALTNQTHLFFPVNNPFSYVPAVSNSPASSLSDSGYGSGFNVSPVAQESPATPVSSAPTTPVTALKPTASQRKSRVSKPKAKTAKKATAATSCAFAHDFSGMPGMQILTKDGVDVTNSARGGKTKEDREHAHLIRLLKSCPTCKRKKIRCDPSHKREIPQLKAATEPQPAVKARTVAVPSPALSQAGNGPAEVGTGLEIAKPTDSFMDALDFDFSLDVADLDSFLNFGTDATDTMDYSFLMEEQDMFTPATPSTVSPVLQNYANFSPAQSFMTSNTVNAGVGQSARLPYLQSEGRVDDYVDFTLFSPASSPLGEEPRELRSAHPSPDHELQQSESPARRGSGVLERTRPASEFVGGPRSPLSPILAQIAVPVVNLAVGPDSGHNLVNSAVDTVRVNPGHGGTGHGGSGHGEQEGFAGVVENIPHELHTLPRMKPQHRDASTEGVRSTDTLQDQTQLSQSTQPQRVARTSTVQQLQQPEQTTQPHDKQSWYSSSGSSLDIRSTIPNTSRPNVEAKSTASDQQLLKTSSVQQIRHTNESIQSSSSNTVEKSKSPHNVAASGEAASQIRIGEQSWTHSAPLSSRNTHIVDTETQTRVEVSICAPATDAQVVYSWGGSRSERRRRREDSAQQTGAVDGSVQQHASTASMSSSSANAALAVVAQSQDPRPAPCPPPCTPCALCTPQHAVINSHGLDKAENSVAARTQTSSVIASVVKRSTTTTLATSSVTVTFGKLKATVMPTQDAVSSLLLVLGAVLMFAAILQNLQDPTLSISKLAISTVPLVLRLLLSTSPPQSSPLSILSSIRKQASTHRQQAAGRCVFV